MSGTLFIASDHAGFELKAHLLRTWKDGITLAVPSVTGDTSSAAATSTIVTSNWKWKDLGPFTADRVDYPDFAQLLCTQLLADRAVESGSTENAPEYKSLAPSYGILICGSGQGMAMSANRFKGIRAALTWNIESTQLSRAHNDANILCLGARLIEPALAVNLVETFLMTPFEGGRHSGRVTKIEC